MIHIRSWVLAAGLFGGPLSMKSPALQVDYRFRLGRAADGTPTLDVRLTVRGAAGDRSRFVVPSSWAGQDSLRNAFSAIDVSGSASIVSDSGGSLVVRHPRGEPVTIHYALRQDWAGAMRYPLYHRVIIDSTHLMINAQNGLIYPELADSSLIETRFSWEGLPSNWPLITSFGDRRQTQARITVRTLINASFVTGRFRLLDQGAAGKQLVVATEGRWRFSDSAYARLQLAVWNLERKFWQDDPFATGFVVLIPVIQRGTVGGTAFTGGFVEFADTASGLSEVVRVAAHELMHLWNGQRVAAAEPEERYKWFTEGFTDYYADRFFHAAGGTSDSGYMAAVNHIIKDYYLSPVAGSTRAAIEQRYWSDADTKLYPYRQGYLLALDLQSQLLRASNGRFDFDSLVRRAYQTSRMSRRRITDSLVVASVPAQWRGLVATTIAVHIDGGDRIPVAPSALGTCAVLASADLYQFDLGFDVSASTRETAVRGVKSDGPAARAGVRDGMLLRGWSWFNGDADREAALQVTDSGVQRTITYLPRGGSPVTTPQFRRDTVSPACQTGIQ